MKNVVNFLKKEAVFSKNERIAVAVSGGADSVALLHFLVANKKLFGIEPVCLNINHSLRGNESDKECQFVKNFASSLNVEYLYKKIEVKEFALNQKLTIEHAARILRYQALFEIANQNGIEKICLAHHKDDQAETVLMHIFRGSGLKGATGMSFVSSSRLIRPFLFVSRTQIEKYLADNNLEYITDSSNSDTKFNRNFVRHIVLKTVKEIYPSVVGNLSEFAEICKIDEDFISGLVPKNLLKAKKNEVLILQKAQNLHQALFSRLIRNAFTKLNGLTDVEQVHIDAIRNLFELQVGKKLDLPNHITAIKEYDGVILFNSFEINKVQEFDFKTGKFEFENWGSFEVKRYNGKLNFSNNKLYIDADKIPKNATIRTRKDGDQFVKFGGKRKKLSDYLVDKKIPNRERSLLPIIADKNNVLAVIGYEISDNVKIDESSQNILAIELLKRN